MIMKKQDFKESRERLTSVIANHLERDKSKDGTICAMDLIQLMQDDNTSFEGMLLLLASARRRVKELIELKNK